MFEFKIKLASPPNKLSNTTLYFQVLLALFRSKRLIVWAIISAHFAFQKSKMDLGIELYNILAVLLASGQHSCSAYAFLVSWECLPSWDTWTLKMQTCWDTRTLTNADILGHMDTENVDMVGHTDIEIVDILGHMDSNNADILGHMDTENADILGHTDTKIVDIFRTETRQIIFIYRILICFLHAVFSISKHGKTQMFFLHSFITILSVIYP